MLTPSQLRTYFPRLVDIEIWAEALQQAMTRFDIVSPVRASAFLAQVAHECGVTIMTTRVRLVENLNYSAPGLRSTWPARFPDDATADAYARQPEKIANRVYADRMGNGDEASGDGWRYRGRGLLMMTGRANYRTAGEALGLDLEAAPELLEQPLPAALAAAQFWSTHGLNQVADAGDEAAFGRITRVINGGTHGLESRLQYWTQAKNVLSA